MPKDIVVQIDYAALIEQWKQQEKEGIEFPVPLHDYWAIAGHKSKRAAVKSLSTVLDEGIDFRIISSQTPQGGRPRLLYFLALPALEHFCMAARTPQGKAVRELYRQAKAKWDMVQKVAPEFAQEIEVLQLKAEIAKQDAIAKQAEQKTLELRHYVTTALPEIAQQKILGYREIVRVEEREVHITPEGDRSDGFGITAIANRYKFKSTRQTWAWLESIGFGRTSPHWIQEQKAVNCSVLPKDYVADLDAAWIEGNGRQRFLGE